MNGKNVTKKVWMMKKVIKTTKLSSDIKGMMKVLSKSDKVVVPTDKTNSIRVIELDFYIELVEGHLNTAATLSPRERLIEIHDDTEEMLEENIGSYSEQEYEFLNEMIETRAIPTPKLLIKDHKNQKPTKIFQQD